MKDTIFSPSFGNRPSTLIGRDELIRQFTEGLEAPAGSRERATLFLGQRGSGKTVLLLELAELARKKKFVVASPTVTSRGMLGRIVEKIQSEGEELIGKPVPKLSGASAGVFGFSAGLQFTRDEQETKSFPYKLNKLCRELERHGKGVLILVDEVQGGSEDLKELVIAYQELVGEGRNLAIAMAGLPGTISTLINEHVLTFLNRAVKIYMDPLAIGEIDAYYSRAFQELGLQIDPERRMTSAERTQGSPYLMQLIGYYLVKYAAEDGSLSESDYGSAIRTAEKTFINDVCKASMHGLSEQDVRFLEAMTADEKWSNTKEIGERLQISASNVQQYKRRLIDAGIIEQPRRGMLQFAVPYLKDYLKDEA